MPTINEILSRNTIEYYECVDFDFGLGKYTNAPWDITIGAHTYLAAGPLLSIGGIDSSAIFDIDTLTFVLAGFVPTDGQGGVADPIIEQIQTLDYIDRSVTVTRVFVKDGVTEQTEVVYSGFVSGLSASVSNNDTTTIAIATKSQWANFQRATSRYTNIKSQQAYYPNDIGFKYAKAVQKEIVWAQPA